MAYDILWKSHAILMSTSFLALLSGILISLIYKKKKWRYKTHRNLGIIAGCTGITALLLAGIMVQVYSGVHFTSRHAIAGAVTALFLILTPLAGLRIRKSKKKKQLRTAHRVAGYITAAFMIFTILSGMIFAGVISLP